MAIAVFAMVRRSWLSGPPLGPRRGCRMMTRLLRRPRKRTVDHVDRVLEPVHRRERTEARALLLAQEHLVKHVEPLKRDARLAIPCLALAGLVQERLAPADFVDDVLDLLRSRIGRQLRKRIAQIE